MQRTLTTLALRPQSREPYLQSRSTCDLLLIEVPDLWSTVVAHGTVCRKGVGEIGSEAYLLKPTLHAVIRPQWSFAPETCYCLNCKFHQTTDCRRCDLDCPGMRARYCKTYQKDGIRAINEATYTTTLPFRPGWVQRFS